VLQHLVGVHDVVGAPALVQGVDVAERELDAGVARGVGAGVLQRLGHRLDAAHAARRDVGGDVDGDRPRAAADVEHGGARAQVRHEVGRRVGDGPDGVGAQHAGGVPVGVGLAVGAHHPMLDLTSHMVQRDSQNLRRRAKRVGGPRCPLDPVV
jgi:hypothetical protein